MSDTSLASVWDPLWEYFLNDYEKEDAALRSMELGFFEEEASQSDSDIPKKHSRRRNQSTSGGRNKMDRVGLLQRFRKQRQGTSTIESAGQGKLKNRQLQPKGNDESRHPKSAGNRPRARKRRTVRNENNDEFFDPFYTLFDIAEKLDAWGGSDTDSNSDSMESEKTDQSDDETADTNADTRESVEIEKSLQSNFCEIRLTRTPSRDQEDEESRQEDVPGNRKTFSQIADESSKERTSFEQSHHDSEKVTKAGAFKPEMFPSDRVHDCSPGLLQSEKAPEDDKVVLEKDLTITEEEKVRVAEKWKNSMCWVNESQFERINIYDKPKLEDSRDFPPAVRMIAENNRKVSSKVGRSEGLNAYNYETDENISVQYCEFGQTPFSSLTVKQLGKPHVLLSSCHENEVIVRVEASTISYTDCAIRQGAWWGSGSPPLPNSPGVDIVGKVYHVSQKAAKQFNLSPSQTVLSLVKWGGNSRYVSINPKKLVKVPEGIDLAQAACLTETYLTAFQVLHLGQSSNLRYRENALKGKSVLIVGAMVNNLGKAIIELALASGAVHIYATAKEKHWNRIMSYGVIPLSQDPQDWISRVEGTVDLVLATNSGLREDVSHFHYRSLNPSGHLILCGWRKAGKDMPVGEWRTQSHTPLMCSKNRALAKIMNKTHSYDVYEQWERNLDTCKQDLTHLLTLLEKQVINPKLWDRIALHKVARAHELLESKRLSGFLVCEPWMRSKKRAVRSKKNPTPK